MKAKVTRAMKAIMWPCHSSWVQVTPRSWGIAEPHAEGAWVPEYGMQNCLPIRNIQQPNGSRFKRSSPQLF